MTKTVRPYQIATLLDDAPDGIRTLSLDCFDTLIWRATHLPQDVFAEFGYPGGGIEPRVQAEKKARRHNLRAGGAGEASIEDIHGLLPAGDAGVAAELALEARHCYAFAPTVELIRRAKASGLQVIIVSDTYLSEPQLRALIAEVGGDELADMIDRIFCSSELGRAKAGGMFVPVLHALQASPQTIMHVGDNPIADGIAATAAGIHAVQIEQFDAASSSRLRLEAAAAAIFDPATRVSQPVLQPHRAAIALRPGRDPAWDMGHDVFGPLLDAFSRWLKQEVAALADATGRPVKPLFLLRDGFLPKAMYEAIGGSGSAVSVSRFTARRASFSGEAAVRDYLDEEETNRVEVLAAQLGLTVGEARKIGTTGAAFRKAVLAPDVVKRIASRSAAFAKRLAAHLRREGRIEKGDAVMLVDLGYRGTVQDLAGAIIEDQLGVTVTGRYMLLTDHHADPDKKRGLFDSRHYDHRMLTALSRQIAIVEQVATSNTGSVIDYADNGRSKHKPCRISEAQATARAAIQDGAIAFARTAADAFHRAPASDDEDGRRRMALAILGRLLFLPQPEEVEVFTPFQHDVNLGTDDLVGIVDHDRASAGLRRRGLSYLREADRMFLPGELRPHGLPLTLTNWLSCRFELDIRSGDFAASKIDVPVFLAHRDQQVMRDFDAVPTHDGYHAVTIPIGAAKFDAGVQLGALGEIVQLEEVAFYRVGELGAKSGIVPTPIDAEPVFDEMEQVADGLWRCGDRSLLFVPPPAGAVAEPLVLRVVFRTVVPVSAARQAIPADHAEAVSA